MRHPRHLAVVLAAILLLGIAAPTAAVDPVGLPTPEPPAGPAGVSVHAQMLAEHESDQMDFVAGDEPSVELANGLLSPPGDGAALLGDGAIAGLPNGLRREVFGYLPYWYLTDANVGRINYGLMSTIAYFGVAARSNGTLARTSQGQPTAGWLGWNSSQMTEVTNRAHALGVKVVLTVTMMEWDGDYAEMSTLLNSSTYRTALVNEIVGTLRARRADGVNLDFEPVPSSLRSQYTSFVRQVKAGLTSAGVGSYVTVASMAGAATWDTGYDVVGLTASGAADALMVMAYDFSWSGSARAGGVAPLSSPHIFDSGEALADHLALVPGSKLIWGVPYYGRAWTTKDGSLNSPTCRTTSVCPSARSDAIGRTWAPRYIDALAGVADHPPRLWDATGRVPWYRWFDSARNAWTQAYYDDAQSLAAKYSRVESNGLRGIGIWTLLMDVGRGELYGVIDEYFQGIWFTDIVFNQFRSDILWIAERGITAGCGEDLFCPNSSVTRGQMAAFLVRALRLPAASRDYFTDDEGSIFEDAINRLAAARITGGCSGTRFCPGSAISRGQMAAFLVRAFHLGPPPRDYFTDDERSLFEGDINRLAAAGIASGCGGSRFCPGSAVNRGQMAAFLRRALT
jgi:spore germination protein YaaH